MEVDLRFVTRRLTPTIFFQGKLVLQREDNWGEGREWELKEEIRRIMEYCTCAAAHASLSWLPSNIICTSTFIVLSLENFTLKFFYINSMVRRCLKEVANTSISSPVTDNEIKHGSQNSKIVAQKRLSFRCLYLHVLAAGMAKHFPVGVACRGCNTLYFNIKISFSLSFLDAFHFMFACQVLYFLIQQL